MIQLLHYLKDPKLWELCYILFYGYAGYISSTVGFRFLVVGSKAEASTLEPYGIGRFLIRILLMT